MCVVTFKDGVSIELHDDCTIDVIDYGNGEDVNLVIADLWLEDDSLVFESINKRLGGCL